MRFLAFLLVLIAPSLALACPACAARESGGLAGQIVLGAMMVLPFGVAAVVIRTIKRAARDDDEVDPQAKRAASRERAETGGPAPPDRDP